jgi:hypothetical protein
MRDDLWSLKRTRWPPDRASSATTSQRSDFWVPRFKLSSSAGNRKALRKPQGHDLVMGAADLPGMLEDDDRERLFVSGIVHKAVIEVAACTTRDLCELGLSWYVAASSGALGLLSRIILLRPVWWRKCPMQFSSWGTSYKIIVSYVSLICAVIKILIPISPQPCV